MATYKATSKKKDSGSNVFKATERKSYDSSYINKWEEEEKEARSILDDYITRRNKNDWFSEDEVSTYKSALDKYKSSSKSLAEIRKNSGAFSDEDEKGLTDYISSLGSDLDTVHKLSSTYKSMEEYKKAVEEHHVLSTYDLDNLARNINDLESVYSEVMEYDKASKGGDRSNLVLRDSTLRKRGYKSIEDLKADIDAKRERYNKAYVIQNTNRVNPESEFYDPESAQWLEKGKAIKNPSYEDAQDGWFTDGKTVNNPVTFTRDNYDTFGKETAALGFNVRIDPSKYNINDLYMQMDDNEVNAYSALLAQDKVDGGNRAEVYLNAINETLEQRKAGELSKPMTDVPALGLVFNYGYSAASAVEDAVKMVTNAEGKKSDPSHIDYMAQIIASENDDAWGYAPEWMPKDEFGDRRTLYGIANDVTGTIGYMSPSILAAALTKGASLKSGIAFLANNASTIGAVVGSGGMGMSSAGSGYQEMIDLGYSKEQARTYGIMVGAAEAATSYALSGISDVGGKLTGNFIKKAADKIDNAIGRFAVNLGGHIGSEILEEEVQLWLEPAIKKAVLDVDFDAPTADEMLYTAIVTAATTFLLQSPGDAKAEIDTYKKGKELKTDGEVDRLAELGKTFSADTVAYQIASKVNKDTGAYTIGRLFNEVGASLSSQNITDITNALVERGIEQSQAETISKWMAKVVNGATLTKRQQAALENNPVLAEVLYGTIIQPNSTVMQRTQAVNQLHGIESSIGIDREALEAEQTPEAITQRLAYKQALGEALRRAANPRSGLSAEQISEIDAFVAANKKHIFAKEKAKNADSVAMEIVERSGLDVSEDSNTFNTKTGESVKIKEIASIKDGVMVLKTDDGNTISAKDVSFSDSDAILYASVLNMGVNAATANSIIGNFDPKGKLTAGQYVLGADEAYKYGRYGFHVSEMSKDGFSADLNEAQRTHAYNLGASDAKHFVDAAQKAVDARKANGKKTSVKGKLHYEGDVSALPDRQKVSVNALQKISEALGVDIYVYESYVKNGKRMYTDRNGKEVSAPNGYYDPSDGSIHIDLYAGNKGEGVMLFTAAHELTHFIKQWSPQKFKVLADFLMEQYGEKGVSVDSLVKSQIAKAAKKGRNLSYDKAYEEVVADSMEKMLADGKVMEKLALLKQKDKTLFDKIKSYIDNLVSKIKSVYKGLVPDSREGQLVAEMVDSVERLQELFTEALVEASDNYQSLMTMEENTDVVPVEGVVMHSYRSLAEASGFEAVENEAGRVFMRNGVKVSEVTVEDIENSPIGAFINYSLEKNDISLEEADRQKKMFADIGTLACKTNDFSMAMQFVGSAVFTGMKANADKQYGTTYDFPSICTKTQAVIDAMSARMIKLGRGLSSDELVKLYQDVFASGNPVPCPECYVFSRWIGIGGLLDNIKKYQDYYGDMDVEDVAKAYRDMREKVAAFADEQGISFGKAKGALTSKLTKEYNKLKEKIEKAQNQGEKVKPADQKKLDELEPMMNTVKGMTWLENVYFADSSLKKVNPRFRVPNDVLFDLNNGEAFATKYKEAWAFRTTQGAGYGKAITPYAEARLGEGVLVTNNTTNAIKGKAQGSLDNFFLRQNGTLDKKARDALNRARLKQLIQAFIGGQRFQSTSDARYENASDYLLAALEMQAMRGMVQVYTKVDGAVPAFSAWGFSINQSLMPLGSGLDAKGNLKDTSVGGMNRDIAFENRKKYETAGTITIGVNDAHIRELFKQLVRDFIIPYHASGGKADLVAAFRSIQEGQSKRGLMVRSTDYSRTQSDKVLSDEVLRWKGKTEAEIKRIHDIRDNRIAILTKGKVDMDVVRSNRFLSALYDKLNGGEWDGVKLAKSKVESQIFPNEFWDQSVSYEESGKITRDYLEYCEDLGFLHRFSGTVPSNGRLVPINGYDQNGNRVQLTDLAYKYENGQKTDQIEEFFWKVLTDRRMYDNEGKYLPQKIVTLNDTTEDTVTSFAKDNYGRQYDKKVSSDTAAAIADKKYSDRSTYAEDFVSHMKGKVKDTGGWYGKDVFKYVEEHPELGFIELLYAKDKNAKKLLENFLNGVDDVKVLDSLSWFMGEAYKDKDRTWSWEDGANYPYRGAVRTFRNAIKKRINAIMTEQVGGTNLGVKNGDVSLQDASDLFSKLNSNEEIGEFAKKVFATAEKLGVNIRFVNQTFSKDVAGDQLGDMVEYKTSYFNDTAVSDQEKARTILHELIHACTVYVMHEDSKYNVMADYGRISNKSDDYVKLRNAGTRLNRIFNEIQRDPDFKGQYGLKNSKEMVAELANERFVALLKKKTLWERIVEAIAELFGFSRGNTAYDNARMCVDYILDNPDVGEYKAHAKEQRGNARYNGMDVFGSTVSEDGSVMYSDRDSEGNTLSKGQQEFFKDSKVRWGESLMPVYHGTRKEFTVFDATQGYDENRAGGLLWAAKDYEYAKDYSYSDEPIVMKGYLNITNLLDIGDIDSYSNYENRLQEIADLVKLTPSELEAMVGYDFKSLKIFDITSSKGFRDRIVKLGYDGVVAYESGLQTFGFVDSNQFKDTTNLNPTSDPDIRYQLREVEPVEPTSDKWKRTHTTAEVKAKFPALWDVSADESEVRNPTQISGTVKSYRKVYDFLKAEGFNGTILDASSGLGYGTRAGVDEYGFDVDDIEPYPDKSYNPKYKDYSKLHKKYDVIISNAVLNVIPQDQRDALVVKMGELLKDGGRMFINVRGDDVKNASSKVAINEDLMEYYISQSGSYQKGFTKTELVAYLQDALGEGFTVQPISWFGKTSAIVTKEVDSIKFQERSTEDISNRGLLANALETAAKDGEEKNLLRNYKTNIRLIEAEQKKLSEIKDKLFAKGSKIDPEERKKLQFEMKQTSSRISSYDRQLLKLEAMQPIQKVLTREKEMAKKRQKQKDMQLLADYKEKSKATVRELLERNQESRKKAIEGREKTLMRHKIKGVVNDLNQLLLKGTKDKHVMIGLQKAVASALDAVNMDTVGADERVAKYNALIAKAKDPDVIASLTATRDRIAEQGDAMSEKFASLKSAYAEIKNSNDPLIANSHDEVIENKIESVVNSVGNTPLRDMTLEQLEDVYDLYKMVLTTIRNSNKAFKMEKAESISSLGNNIMGEIYSVAGEKQYTVKALEGLKKFGWSSLKPTQAFEAIGSGTFKKVFANVRAGEDTWAVDVNEAREYYREKTSKYGYDSWDLDQRFEFTSKSGKKFYLSLEQIMSLYAYSKRKQADLHLEQGGFVFDEAIEVSEKKLGFIPVKYKVNTANAYSISKEELGNIIGTLSDRQRFFVDEMQAYLSDVMGAKGNEVSLEMYGVKLFKEQFYFPLKSAKQFMFEQNEVAGEVRIKNSGFSKETVARANNPIILSNFMDVWSKHVNDMSMYHAFVLPLEDFNRVFNYKTPTSDKFNPESVKSYLQNAYGTQPVDYIKQLITDLNGGARSDASAGFVNKGISLFKKGAVFASASVVIQQPSAIARAFAYINPKYFVTAKVDLTKHSRDWEECKQYAPVARIKEMGYFDTNVGPQTTEWITSKEYKGFKAKLKGLKDSNYRDEILSKAPALADEITWTHIWNAVKKEIASTTNLKVGSEEFLKRAGERFTEVVVNTQVYDSVLTRSGLMRSKDTGVKMATAFMAEPTTSLNMIVNAFVQSKRGNKKLARNIVGGVASSIILNSILVSLVYAARDDDDDETYAEKYLGSLTSELLDGFNPITYIPFAKDLWSIAQGYDVERSDMSVYSKLWQSFEELFDENKSVVEKVTDFSGSVATLFGLPLKNIMRDVEMVINTVTNKLGLSDTTKAGLGYSAADALRNSVPLVGRFYEEDTKAQKLYDAILGGDATEIKRAKSQFKDEKAIDTAIKTALRENDPRIKEAAQARIDGDISKYKSIVTSITSEGNFSQDLVVKATNAEINKINSEADDADESSDDEDESKETSIYKASDINAALENGDTSTALEVIDDMVKVKTNNYIAEGKSKKEAEKSAKSSIRSSVTSYWKPIYLAAYKSKNSTEMTRIRKLLKATDLYDNVVETCQDWVKQSKKTN